MDLVCSLNSLELVMSSISSTNMTGDTSEEAGLLVVVWFVFES